MNGAAFGRGLKGLSFLIVTQTSNLIRLFNSSNRPRSIYQYSNMVPRLSGQTSIFGVVFFVSKSLFGN